MSFDLSERYTLWSGLIAALFLFLAYFGCDQSQVQRYLTARSVDEGRVSLMMSAFLKIPLQFLILLIGVLIFVFAGQRRVAVRQSARVHRAQGRCDPAALFSCERCRACEPPRWTAARQGG